MQQRIFRNKIDYQETEQQIMWVTKMMNWSLMLVLLLQQMKTTDGAKYKGDICVTKKQPGICQEWSDCPIIKTLIDNGEYSNREVVSCGFGILEELICCPVRKDQVLTETKNVINKNGSPDTEPTPTVVDNPDSKTTINRPAVRACRRIDSGLNATLSPHILGGTPAELGEFPHMVAIGYSRIGGDDRPPYDIRCGGTLIDKRFVLTAAHCVADRESIPSIVRLGVVNFTDPAQMSVAVEIRIKETFIHNDYSTSKTYNDIAILELESEVKYSEYIYPVCLYMDEKDPDAKIKLWVTGWGTVNTTTRSFSDILLKAPLHTTPLENCNESFAEYGLNRKISQGILKTQLCAEDKDRIKDACQGDSGGPLNMIIDESYKKYRLVGVISSGIDCASTTPGLYTRVSAYLDFIESIVWPNGGD